jgi:Cu(I)/Ag(I) efflux system membrane fusion protein
MRRLPLLVATLFAFLLGIAVMWLWMHYRVPMSNSPTATAAGEKALYWYDPMVPDKHFEQPGKSPFMDMQLVPKYAGAGSASAGTVVISPRVVQNLGVRTERAVRGSLTTSVRATGTIVFDERAVSIVQSRVPGIVEHLFVRAPLTRVHAGEALLSLLAPDWAAAQEEYLSLQRARATGLDALRTAARQRLILLGMSEGQIRAAERSGRAQTRITISAPRDGVVGELNVRDGASVAAGTPLLRINGLDAVWMNAAIPESQRSRIADGASVRAEFAAFPGETFDGIIEALLPDVDATTRTQMARIVLKNPQAKLAPGMYASITVTPSSSMTQSVLVPTEAVIVTGARNVVIVDAGNGEFRAQEVRLGDEANGKTAILDGIKDGDNVVLSGQFLIDSEASLTGTLARLSDSSGDKSAMPLHADADQSTPQELQLAQGKIERIEGDRWTIATDAIASMNMGAMTMTFVGPQRKPSEMLRAGQRVSFAFFRNGEGAFEIARIAAVDGGGTP